MVEMYRLFFLLSRHVLHAHLQNLWIETAYVIHVTKNLKNCTFFAKG